MAIALARAGLVMCLPLPLVGWCTAARGAPQSTPPTQVALDVQRMIDETMQAAKAQAELLLAQVAPLLLPVSFARTHPCYSQFVACCLTLRGTLALCLSAGIDGCSFVCWRCPTR